MDSKAELPLIRLRLENLNLEERLPWDIYDANRNLLYGKGKKITSDNDLEKYRATGELYRETTIRLEDVKNITVKQDIFDAIIPLAERQQRCLRFITDDLAELPDRFRKIAVYLYHYVETNPDDAIGVVHLFRDFSYVVHHPLHVAILSILLAISKGYDDERCISLACAALSKHISINELQLTLYEQTEPLSEEEREIINQYPRHSYRTLRDAGVADKVWLKAVLQHQEKGDGSGYPQGLKSGSICEEAEIIGVCDRYAAMVSERKSRIPELGRTALKKMYSDNMYPDGLVGDLIKILGVFPPGTCVRLNTGDIALVVERGETPTTPLVCCFQQPNGRNYSRPVQRETGDKVKIDKAVATPDLSKMSMKWLWGRMYI